ncbi:MAG: response regulator transcription factor [Lachnospiraceae bacterium]|nr:response regulator transcription factor [Lachnospiraceae bacterium]
MNIGICDDEKEIVFFLNNAIKELVQNMGIEVQLYFYYSGEMLLDAEDNLDILFLDIEMPGTDGIETGKRFSVKNRDCKIIMATSKVERFKEAFKINAFRFVTKPFLLEEIKEALVDVIKSMIGMEKIQVYKQRNQYEIFQKDILYIVSVDSYVEIFVKEGKFRSETSLTKLEEELEPALFCRVNRQCIVSLKWIESYKKDEIVIGENRIKVSIRRKKEFERRNAIYDMEYR